MSDKPYFFQNEQSHDQWLAWWKSVTDTGTILHAFREQKKFNDMWNALGSGIYFNLIDAAFITGFLTQALTNKFFTQLYQNGLLETYLTGFKKFYHYQKLVNDQELIKILNANRSSNNLYYFACLIKQDELAEDFKRFNQVTDLASSASQFKSLISSGRTDMIACIFNTSSNLNYDNSYALKYFLSLTPFDFPFYEKIITEYQLDINALGSSYGSHHQASFAMLVAARHGVEEKRFFQSFVEKFGSNMDMNSICKWKINDSYYPIHFFEFIRRNTLILPVELLDRFEAMLQHCLFNEVSMSNLLASTVHAPIVSEYANHSFYERLFSHPVFKSSLIDKASILDKILSLDKSSEFRQVRESNNQTINPTTIILNTFFQHVEKDSLNFTQHPFIKWANQQNNNFSVDTFRFLFNFFEDSIRSLTPDYFTNIGTSALFNLLHEQGIQTPGKKTLWGRLFGGNNETKPIIQSQLVKNTVVHNPAIESIAFNKTLFQQVTQKDILYYISAIELNAEQFLLFNHDSQSENDYYIKQQLPRLLNRTIENYLHFASMEVEAATGNTLIQLKLLNKKTFDVLSEVLNHEKAMAEREGNVQTRILKSY